MVPIFSGSRPFTLKSSSKRHQNATYFIQNDEVFTKTKSLFSQYSFWMRKDVIWWLFNDDLRSRGQEPEKKETTNSPQKWLFTSKIEMSTSISNFLRCDHDCATTHCLYPKDILIVLLRRVTRLCNLCPEEQFLCADEQKCLGFWKFKRDFRNPLTPLCQFVFLRDLAGFFRKTEHY